MRRKCTPVIFGVDTWGGKTFDIVLLFAIFLSVVVVMLESVDSFEKKWGSLLNSIEWTLTILFTIEYVPPPHLRRQTKKLRIQLLRHRRSPRHTTLPTSRFGSEAQNSLGIIRVFRLLRIFRILKLASYLKEADHLWIALRATRQKITVFLFVVLTLVLILGSLMYIVEDGKNGFTNIPQSVYWAIVTVTTVGYGDITPSTNFGKAIASAAMILGYSLIVVPNGRLLCRSRKRTKRNRRVKNYSTKPTNKPTA